MTYKELANLTEEELIHIINTSDDTKLVSMAEDEYLFRMDMNNNDYEKEILKYWRVN